MMTTVLVVVLATFFTFVNSKTSDVIVTTKKGTIVGVRYDPNPATGVAYDAFLGIPYGQISARFQVASPRSNWTGNLTTKTDGPACPQPGRSYSEDCLYLNVFTPQVPTPGSTDPKYPVMAYIHGSAFTRSSSSSNFYGPDFLIPEKVVLVAFNYRLGAAGFLTLGSKVAPGNLGLTDSLLALKWIQDEIQAFGGDPTQVTLFGQSAGSAMVTSHYLSPQSTGLFKYAIAQSGSALSDWALIPLDEAVWRAKTLAQAVGCPTEIDSDTIACLQNEPIESIVGNQSIPLPSVDMISGSGGLRFVPVLDSYLTADYPFFNDTLNQLKAAALARGKPLMTGTTTDDGIVKLFLDDSWKQGEGNLAYFIPRSAREVSSNYQKYLWAQAIQAKYFTNTFDENKVINSLRLNTDTLFSYPAAKISTYFANLTYSYVFQYFGSWPPPTTSFYRLTTVSHGAELPYIFYFNGISLPLDICTLNAANIAMKDKMVKWWTTFAKTGVPDTNWPLASLGYMIIDSQDSIMNASTFNSTYYDFWAAMENKGSIPRFCAINLFFLLAVLWTQS